jgi:DNA transformation protein
MPDRLYDDPEELAAWAREALAAARRAGTRKSSGAPKRKAKATSAAKPAGEKKLKQRRKSKPRAK